MSLQHRQTVRVGGGAAVRRWMIGGLAACLSLATAVVAKVPDDGKPDFGFEGYELPQPRTENGTNPRMAEILGQLLRSSKMPSDRVGYLRELAVTQLPAALDHIIPMLRDPDPTVRAQAAVSMIGLAGTEHIGSLQAVLQDPDERVRAAALRAVAHIDANRPDDATLIRPFLEDSSALVVQTAILNAKTGDDARALAEALPKLPPEMQRLALSALGRIGRAEFATAATPFLTSSVQLKSEAAAALGQMKATGAMNDLVRLLDDPHPTVRRSAIAAMAGVAPTPRRHELAMRMLKDGDLSVRTAAVEVLTPIPTQEALALIVPQLAEPYRPLHAASRKALTAEGPAEMRDPIIRAVVPLLDSPDARRREDASFVLGHYRSPAGLAKHIEQARFKANGVNDWILIAQAVRSLGRIGEEEARDTVLALASVAPGVPPTAEGSLGFSSVAVSNAIVASARLRDKRILPAAIRVARSSPMNTDAEMRAASAFALGVLSDSPDEQTVGILSDLMAGSMEIEPTHAEAAKALGTLRATEALGSLRSARGSSPEPITRYMAHLAVLRITGKEEPYEPPVVRYQARTSVNIPDER